MRGEGRREGRDEGERMHVNSYGRFMVHWKYDIIMWTGNNHTNDVITCTCGLELTFTIQSHQTISSPQIQLQSGIREKLNAMKCQGEIINMDIP